MFVVVVVVADLPRAPDDWDQRRHSCAGAESVWKQGQQLVERCVNSVQTVNFFSYLSQRNIITSAKKLLESVCVLTKSEEFCGRKNADEGVDLPASAGPAVHRAGAFDRVLPGTAVPESHFARPGSAGGFLPHAVQYHCTERVHSYD